MKKGGLEYRDEEVYEAVQFIGYFREFDRKKIFHTQFSLSKKDFTSKNVGDDHICKILQLFSIYPGNDVEIDELLPSTSSSRTTTDTDLKYLQYFFFKQIM